MKHCYLAFAKRSSISKEIDVRSRGGLEGGQRMTSVNTFLCHGYLCSFQTRVLLGGDVLALSWPPPPRPIHGGTWKDARPFRWRWLITARGVPAKVVLGAEEGQGYQEKTQVLLMRSEYHKTFVLPAPVASCGVLGEVQLKENNLARRLLG